jgi:hypothetical protein
MIFRRNFPTPRRSPRQWLNTSVQLFKDSTRMDALGINLSEGGMCLFTVANLPVGSRVDVEFLPPRAMKPVRIAGRIRHRALYLYGIEFVSEIERQAHLAAALGGLRQTSQH